jgi:opacity protein-like surface antigen
MLHTERFDRLGAIAARTAPIVCQALALIAIATATAHAEASSEDFARPGWYLGLGAIYAISDYDLTTDELDVVPPEPTGVDPEFANTGGVDFRAGYRVHPRWAFEFDYQWQAGFDSAESSIDPMLEIDTHLLSLDAKLFAATGRWQPYVLLGAGLLIVNTEIVDDDFEKPWDLDTGFAPRFGAGLDVYLDEHWALTLEGTYLVSVGTFDDVDMGSAGAGFQYRF